jgi:hypothetical protein
MVVSLSRFLVESHSATPGGILSHQKINCQHPDAKKKKIIGRAGFSAAAGTAAASPPCGPRRAAG